MVLGVKICSLERLIYDEKLAENMVKDIAEIYYPELKKLYNKLIEEL